MTPSLLLRGVSKRYAGHVAVEDLSLAVPSGTIYGILGPNGAGKSTTIRMSMNIIAPDTGEVKLLGHDPAVDRRVLHRVGYLPEERGLYRKMKVLDVVVFFARLKGVDAATARREGERWLERMGLSDWRKANVETLSKGMQQKVQFIATVVHRPELLILDEPASGLDPVNQEVLTETILEARREGRTVIFSTHNMGQAEALCEAVCIIADGRKVLDGDLGEIRRAHRGKRWRVEYDPPPPGAEERVARAAAGGRVEAVRGGWEVELADASDARTLLQALADLDEPPLRFERVQPSLHDLFMERVGGTAATARRREVAHA